jgi:hypothetical protein
LRICLDQLILKELSEIQIIWARIFLEVALQNQKWKMKKVIGQSQKFS